MKQVVFIKKYIDPMLGKTFFPGDCLEIEDNVAKILIKNGFAKTIEPSDKKDKPCILIYPGKVASGYYWFINNNGEAFIKEKISQKAQRVEIQKQFNFKATNNKIINFEKGDIVYLAEEQYMAMKKGGRIV